MHDAIALFSSARRLGNTGMLLDRVAALARLEIVDLAALRIAPYDYEHRHRDDDFEPLFRRVLDHAQIVFASPVYWSAPNAPLKAFLDRMTDYLDLPDLLALGRRLRGKTGHVVCTSICRDAPNTFVGIFAETFDYLGMALGGVAHVDCERGYDAEAAEREARSLAGRLHRDRSA